MPLYVCEDCNHLEDTAWPGFAEQRMAAHRDGHPNDAQLRCSKCSTGEWYHEDWTPREWDGTEPVINRDVPADS